MSTLHNKIYTKTDTGTMIIGFYFKRVENQIRTTTAAAATITKKKQWQRMKERQEWRAVINMKTRASWPIIKRYQTATYAQCKANNTNLRMKAKMTEKERRQTKKKKYNKYVL